MILQNNSKNKWENYDLGHTKITIEPESIFEVDETTGTMLLRLIGAPAWITKYVEVLDENDIIVIDEPVEEAPIEEEVVEEAPIEEEVVEEAPKKKGKK